MNTSSVENVTSSFPASTFSLSSMSINMILGLPLNGYVIWLILGAPRETMASDLFSLNLAMSELFFTLSGIWIWIVMKFNSLFFQSVFHFSLGLLYTARPLFQCCICVEYYVAVIHPVVFLRFKPLRYRVACCCVVWLIILLSCIYNFCTSLIPLYLFLYFIQTLLLFCVMLFCCLSVLWALKRPGPGERDTGKKKSNAQRKRYMNQIQNFRSLLWVLAHFKMGPRRSGKLS
ncbi:proteinase-activated receptor 3-like [Labrus mixtus]|uniref:proteinase-activated receptor 3-like n=1 Tax=Labrus mixtus TaxID=508554 RepID=UPI0029C05228|nr:proteinase-activated receptor 3-like [Labrus mixtus]